MMNHMKYLLTLGILCMEINITKNLDKVANAYFTRQLQIEQQAKLATEKAYLDWKAKQPIWKQILRKILKYD